MRHNRPLDTPRIALRRRTSRLVLAICVMLAATWTMPSGLMPSWSSPAGTWAAEPAEAVLGPQTGILVLRNGNLLRGDIAQLGDRYIVTLDARNEVRIPTSEVALKCENLQQVYQFKREALPPGQVSARLDLAEWCLRNGLRKQAADEATVAMRLEPDNPRLANLERRIHTPPAAPSTPQAAPSTPPATAEQLELAARELPFGVVERFTLTIQPMLLNRCGANSCHGAGGENDFHLLRPPLGQTTTRRFTLRNLHSALQRIDRENPDQSRLLTMARQAHGTAKSAAYGSNEQMQYELLAAWVRQIQSHKTANSAAPATITRPGGQLLQTTPVSAAKNAASESPSVKPQQPQPAPAPSPGAGRDPFDPDLFNTRFGAGDR